MFDPITGKIDHNIAKQWEKYDLKKVLEKTGQLLALNYRRKYGFGWAIGMGFTQM